MNITKTLITTVAATTLATASFAGGLSPEIMEAPVVVEDEMAAPAGTSVSPLLIVGGILAGVLIYSLLDEDDDGDEEMEEIED